MLPKRNHRPVRRRLAQRRAPFVRVSGVRVPDQGRGRGLAQVVLRCGGDMARIVPAGPVGRLRDVVRSRRRPARLRGRRSWRPRIGRFVDRMATRRRPDCTSPSTAGRCPYPSTPEWSRRRPPRPSGSASRPSDARSRGGDCGRSRRRTATSHRPTASTGAHGTHRGNQVNKRGPSGLPQAGRRPSGRAPRWFLRDAWERT